MSRKTINVKNFVDRCNEYLAAEHGTPEMRQGVAIALENALFMSNTYGGFSYLASEYLPAEEQTEDNVLRPDYDNSRRVYSTWKCIL